MGKRKERRGENGKGMERGRRQRVRKKEIGGKLMSILIQSKEDIEEWRVAM